MYVRLSNRLIGLEGLALEGLLCIEVSQRLLTAIRKEGVTGMREDFFVLLTGALYEAVRQAVKTGVTDKHVVFISGLNKGLLGLCDSRYSNIMNFSNRKSKNGLILSCKLQ